MNRLAVILVAACGLTVGADGYARHHKHHPVAAAVEKAHHKASAAKRRARNRIRRTTTAPRPSYSDELALSPSLMKQIQRNLVDGGYYSGALDGRLTPRTRRALVDFQREYHLEARGHLNRATAEALLGRDVIVAAAPPARG
jgi:peptidoglycan hydrolase-like protein with peptidoglycan-binding domain